MKRWLVAAGLVLGLAGGAQAQPVSGGLLGRGASYSSFVAPPGCVSSSVPFFGASVALGCDGGITYDSTGRALTTETVKATSYAAQAKTVTITGATNATPIVVTATAHGLYTGDWISISGITGNTNANGFFKITRLTADTFSLQNYSTGADIAGNGAYGGTPVAVTGIVQAQRVMVGDGTTNQPALAPASDPGTGWMFPIAGNVAFTQGTSERIRISSFSFSMRPEYSFGWASAGPGTSDLILSRAAAATLQLGAANAASPIAQTLQAQGATGTDVAGANLTIRPGAGTGAATASKIIFQTPTVAGSSSTQQTQASRLEVQSTLISALVPIYASGYQPQADDTSALGASGGRYTASFVARATLGSKPKALTDGSPVTFATFTIADAAMYSGEIIYNVKAVKGTDIQVLASKVRFTAARVGTNYYVSVAAIGSDVVSVSTGTLTCPISISGTGGVISLAATADTSFASPDSLVGQFRFDSPDAGLTLTFP